MEKLDLLGATARVDATPRRLVVQAAGLPERTPDREEIVKGPPVASGEKAAAGFARKQGVDPSEMQGQRQATTSCTRRIPGRAAAEILADSLPGAILGIQWPKTMYWTGGKTGPRFIRPIRWIVALLGDQVIPFRNRGRQKRQRHAWAPHPRLVFDPGNHGQLRNRAAQELRHSFLA